MIDTNKPVKIKGEDWPVTILDADFNGNIGVAVETDGIKSFHVFDKHGRQKNSRLGMQLINACDEELSVWLNVYAPSERHPKGLVSRLKSSREGAELDTDRSGFCGERVAMVELTFKDGRLWAVDKIDVSTSPGADND
jgi:hypothetical protein